MLNITIDKEDVKIFMNKLLKENAFDELELRSFDLENIIKYSILGDIDKDYIKDYEKDEQYIRWKEVKPYVLKLVAGDKKHKYIKIVFSLEKGKVEDICSNINAMFLNIYYENDIIKCTTATSQKQFSLDRAEDEIWENTVLKFFKKNQIPVIV